MHALPRPIQILLLALVLLLALYPLYGEALLGGQHDYFLQKLTTIMALGIMAASLDLLVGVTGMVSVAHAAFFGLSGYALVLLAPQYAPANVWIALPISLAAAALAALIMGILVIRTKGIFFIMATIAFSQMLFYLFHDARFAGGSDGILMFFSPALPFGDSTLLDLDNNTTLFYVTLVSMVMVYLLLRMLLRSPFGRVLFAIKENEGRVKAVGFNPLAYKLTVFVIAGTVAGYAGFLSATQYGYVSPNELHWVLSAKALVMVILGGMGTLFGAIIGAFAFEGLHYFYSALTHESELLMGITIIALVLLLPRGIAGFMLGLCRPRRRKDTSSHEPAEETHTLASPRIHREGES